MNLLQKLKLICKKKINTKTAPLLIIQKEVKDTKTKEYDSIEKAIEDLEKDTNVPKDKLDKLKNSLNDLKNKNSKIIIMNGEIVS